MKLSSRSRHAISAMLELALQDEKGDTPIVDMARKYNISQSSMEQLFARLRAKGLVTGRRGRRGGYRLSRAPEAISVAEIVASVDDEKLGRDSGAPVVRRRMADALWDNISQQLYDFLSGITLADVLQKRHALGLVEEDAPAAGVTDINKPVTSNVSRYIS